MGTIGTGIQVTLHTSLGVWGQVIKFQSQSYASSQFFKSHAVTAM